ncbi:MAG: hypothetical protein ACR2G6_10300, partial [Gemmatimonadaceae bacterium]
VAGVASVPGRGWYGIRRVTTDAAADITTDERVLNLVSGHKDSSTRRLVYQDRGRPEDLNRAADVRGHVRSGTGRQVDSIVFENVKLA